MRIKFIYSFILVSLLSAPPALAKEDCETATTSADVMRCVNQHHEDAQANLKDVFKTLSLKKSGETLEGIEALQTLWIEYRDRECEAEVSALSSEALKRLEGIKCKTRLTRERINALQKTLDAETGAAVLGEPPAAQQPRWVNALSEQYQNVYWHYGGVSKGDADCDADEEFVIAGLEFDEESSTYRAVVAVSENPETGKPTSTLITIPAVESEEEAEDEKAAKECSGLMSFSFESREAVATEQDTESEKDEDAVAGEEEAELEVEDVVKTCTQRLVIARKASDGASECSPVAVLWDGQNYVIEQ